MDSQDDSVVEIPRPCLKYKFIDIQMERGVGTEEKIIVLGQEGRSAGWSVDARLRNCSEFLQCLQDEVELDNRVQLCITLPSTLKINAGLIFLMEDFYQRHHYTSENITINKITMEGYKKALDPTSLTYLESSLSKQSEESIRHLLNLAQYLKLNDLKQLLTVYIASQHFFNFNDKIMQKKIIEAGAFYSRQEEIALGYKLKPYAQQLSSDLLENLRNKYSVMSAQMKPSS